MLLDRQTTQLRYRRKLNNMLEKREDGPSNFQRTNMSFDNLLSAASQDVKLMRFIVDEANSRGMINDYSTAHDSVSKTPDVNFFKKRQ